MAGIKIFTLLVLCAVLAVTLGHQSQGGPNESQGGPHESQEGSQESQGGSQESQGGSQESQGGPHESQGGSQETEGGSQESQDGPHESQGGPHEIQDNVNQLTIQEDALFDIQAKRINFTTCDITTTPTLSCADCNTRLVCRPVIGGILISCSNPYQPYCINGVCSPVPSSECA